MWPKTGCCTPTRNTDTILQYGKEGEPDLTSAAQEKNKIRSLLERMPSKECHCNRCGARIAEGDARCAACGKKQQVKNTNLLDFLIAHTKDEITG